MMIATQPLTDAEIAAELHRAEPAISYAVNRMLPVPPQDREDAAQTARLGLLAAMRRGHVFRSKSGFAIAARNAVTNNYRCGRSRRLKFDPYEQVSALSAIPSREPDATRIIAGEESLRVVMATLRKRFKPRSCRMFEHYLRGFNQRDICRMFQRSKARVCTVINEMLTVAAEVLGEKRATKGK